MITREDRLPYDRPNLSKDYLAGNAEPEWMPLRPDDFFERYDIELLRGREVVGVDSSAKEITFEDGENLKYDAMLIATGGVPRSPGFVTGAEENVFLLRSFRDADTIVERAEKGSRAVVIGSSFIGMEAAASFKTRACDVTVVSPDEVPFEKVLGADIGTLFRDIHEQNGIKFKLGRTVRGLTGSEKVVEGVELDNGELIDADLVVVGIGVRPATDLLTGVEIHKDGGVITDEHLCVGEDLYAAGDIAHFPDARTGEMTRIEHWRTALQLGRTAAHNMAGKSTVFAAVPFFWTTQFDATLNYVGHVREWDSVVFQGEPESREFLAFYIKDHRILAVAGMNRDRDIAIWDEMIRLNQVPSPSQLTDKENFSDLLSYSAPTPL
jgi:NADPH-dependent 2,4-dienoyl-CoA reductase/sulfur reductase-like enzyme